MDVLGLDEVQEAMDNAKRLRRGVRMLLVVGLLNAVTPQGMLAHIPSPPPHPWSTASASEPWGQL